MTVRTDRETSRAESEYAWGDSTRWGDNEMASKVASLMPHVEVADLLAKIAYLETQPDIAFIAQTLRTPGSGSRGANGPQQSERSNQRSNRRRVT